MARRTRPKKKTYTRILRRMQGKLWFLFGLICVLFVVLIGRLMFIEYTSGEKYEKIVLSQQEYDSEIISYQRGDIVDSKGTVLATSVDVYNIILDCKVLNANEEDIDATVSALVSCFPELNSDEIYNTIHNKSDSQYQVLAKKVPYEEMAAFQAIMDDEKTKDTISGIWFEKEYIRSYPYGTLASSLLGFAAGNTGVIGLENQYNSQLNGVNGRSYGYLNTDNNLEQTVVEPQNGNTIESTIDVNIQTIVEQEILNFNQQYATEDKDGSLNTAVLVMNPQNGEILAMANYPTFDLNNPRDLSAYYTEEELANMSEEDQLNVLNGIWQNFCVSHTYEPGSTFKPFTVATGLETGTLTGDEVFLCDGGEQIGPDHVSCVNTSGHGEETVAGSLMDSCNDALMQMSVLIGADNFNKFQRLFGFGQKTQIDLPGEPSTAGLLYDEASLEKRINLATNSFGQNFNVTMVQLASAFSSLINGGDLYQPHVVKKITDSAGNLVQEVEPIVQKETISEEVSNQVKEYMLATVNEGTAKTAAVEGYAIGGKTGTAQKLPRADRTYLVSFIGYAPQENPEVLIYVIVDEPNVADQAHSSFAQQIAHNVLLQILPYMNIPRITTEPAQ